MQRGAAWCNHHPVIRHSRLAVERPCDIRPPSAAHHRPAAAHADNRNMLLVGLLATTWLALAAVALRAAATHRATLAHQAEHAHTTCRSAQTHCGYAQENGPSLIRRQRAHYQASPATRRGARHSPHRTPHRR